MSRRQDGAAPRRLLRVLEDGAGRVTVIQAVLFLMIAADTGRSVSGMACALRRWE